MNIEVLSIECVIISFLAYNSERVTDNPQYQLEFRWFDAAYVITRLEAFDQSNGTGGHVYWIDDGLDHRRVSIFFNPSVQKGKIDFIVNIYGEPVLSNDIIEGDPNDKHFTLFS